MGQIFPLLFFACFCDFPLFSFELKIIGIKIAITVLLNNTHLFYYFIISLEFPDLLPSGNSLESLLSHSVGNMMNEIIFGTSYDREDPTWKEMQRLREEGERRWGESIKKFNSVESSDKVFFPMSW